MIAYSVSYGLIQSLIMKNNAAEIIPNTIQFFFYDLRYIVVTNIIVYQFIRDELKSELFFFFIHIIA